MARLRPYTSGITARIGIGLSATQRPLDTISRFLGGAGPGRADRLPEGSEEVPVGGQ